MEVHLGFEQEENTVKKGGEEMNELRVENGVLEDLSNKLLPESEHHDLQNGKSNTLLIDSDNNLVEFDISLLSGIEQQQNSTNVETVDAVKELRDERNILNLTLEAKTTELCCLQRNSSRFQGDIFGLKNELGEILSTHENKKADVKALQTELNRANTSILNLTGITETNDSLLLDFQNKESDVMGYQMESKIASTIVIAKVAELENNKLKLLSMTLNTEANFDHDTDRIEKFIGNNGTISRIQTKDVNLESSLCNYIHLNEKLASVESDFRKQEEMNIRNREMIDQLMIENVNLKVLLKENSDNEKNELAIETEEALIDVLQHDGNEGSLTFTDDIMKKNESLEIEITNLRNLYADREKDFALLLESTLLVKSECLEEKNALLKEKNTLYEERNAFFFEKQDIFEELERLKLQRNVLGLENTEKGIIEKNIILEEIEKMKLGKNRSEKKFKEILHTNETNISKIENTVTALELLKSAMENRIDQLEDEKNREIEKHELLVQGLLKAAGLQHNIGHEGNDDTNCLVHLFMKQVDEERLKVNALKSCLMQFGSQMSDDDNKNLLDTGIILIPQGMSPPSSPVPPPTTISSRFRFPTGLRGKKIETNIT